MGIDPPVCPVAPPQDVNFPFVWLPNPTPNQIHRDQDRTLAPDPFPHRHDHIPSVDSGLAKEWRVESRKLALTESGIIGPSSGYGPNTAELRASVYSKLNESLDGLGYYKRKLEQCLEPQNCGQCDGTQCGFVAHAILHLRGKPKLAACAFSLGIRGRENWGLTVVPLSDGTGHDVIWHHFGEHPKVMEKRISLQRKAQGRKREELVSQCVLRLADALVASPEWWDSIGTKRRDAILEMVSGETGIATGTPEQVSLWANRANSPILDLPNPRQLNLFRDD